MKLSTSVLVVIAFAVPGLNAQPATWEQNLRMATNLAKQGQIADAERLYLSTVRETEKFGPDDERFAAALAGTAIFYMEQGQSEKALPFATRALAIRARMLKAAEKTSQPDPFSLSEVPRDDVIVNGVALSQEQLGELGRYGTRPRPGRYWYDRVSGAWGLEGGPMAGQVLPNLAVGGPLRPDASGGGTSVFVNGRELHPMDVAALQRCTPVYRGRYWVNAQGIGGYEGRMASFNLAMLCQQATGSRSSSSNTWHNGDGSWTYRNSVTGLGAVSDGTNIYITGK